MFLTDVKMLHVLNLEVGQPTVDDRSILSSLT